MTSFYHVAKGPTWAVIDDDMHFGHLTQLKSLIGQDVFFASIGWDQQDWTLPKGHRAYLVMVEGPETSWFVKQTQIVDAPIFVLGLANNYGFSHSGIHYFPYIEWHNQFQDMLDSFVWPGKSRCEFMISSLSARITQSKIWASMAIMDYLPKDHFIMSLNDRVELKNVHDWQKTQNASLDQLTNQFQNHFFGKTLSVDIIDFNHQTLEKNHDYTAFPYLKCVFNVNNESWHYSYHYENGRDFCWPGPFLTEKTMKVLLSETALISNGQFETYKTLESLGFKFDYGLDLSYDLIPGNIDRAIGMIELIKRLNDHDIDTWFDRTLDSRRHNRQHIVSGNFHDICESLNRSSVEKIHALLP